MSREADEFQSPEPEIWRLHFTSDAETRVDPGDFCTRNNVAGFGWRVEPDEYHLPWDTYYSRARAKYLLKNRSAGWAADVNAIRRMKRRDLCWTRTANGKYWLGRISGGWEYRNRPENYEADVLNVRECIWAGIGGMHEVPGKVINSFRGSSALQRVEGNGIRLFSTFTSNSVHPGKPYPLPKVECNAFTLLCREDCADIIGVYLQTKGYVLFPGTCKRDTRQFEYVLRHRESGRYAAVQVKEGRAVVRDQDYWQFDGDVFLFQTDGAYQGPTFPNVRRLSGQELLDYCESNQALLPARIQRWMAILAYIRGST